MPPGWDEWFGLMGPDAYAMYGYRVSRNGTVVRYGTSSADYQTDVLARTAVDAIRRGTGRRQPLFLSIAPLADHLECAPRRSGGEYCFPPRPAPRHTGRFADASLPRPPSFNEADVSDKPQVIRKRPVLTGDVISDITTHYRRRLASLLAVDDLVERVVTALGDAGQLDNTVVLFTSDNGYLLGHHRIPGDKYQPYEESIRVPLVVRGPGFPAARTVHDPVVNVDLAPTIVQLAEATPGRTMDGRSFRALALGGHPSARDILLETGPRTAARPGAYHAIRTPRYLYVERATGETELYDMANDPYQLTSRHADPSYAAIRRRLATTLARLRGCAGSGCLISAGSGAR